MNLLKTQKFKGIVTPILCPPDPVRAGRGARGEVNYDHNHPFAKRVHVGEEH